MKSVKLLLTSIMFFTSVAITQAQTKWTIGINGSPALTQLEMKRYSSQFSLAYGAGLSSLYFINSQMFLRTGLNYKVKSYLIKNFSGKLMLEDNAIIDPNEIKIKHHYLTVPLILNYKLSKGEEEKNTYLFISNGLELNYLFRTVTNIYLSDEKLKNVGDFDISINNFIVGLNIGFGLYQQISSKINLLLRCEYSHDFDYLNYNSLGLSAELHYKLK